jgi:peptidoglycan/LPS O-acetylase OafA/YrhL
MTGDRLRPIDGLRGIAIALVLWFHIWELTWQRADVTLFGSTSNFNWICETGFLGVDLFFFISGFCLFYPYARALFDGRPMQTVREFAFRRAIKIVPSYVLAIFGMIAFGLADFPTKTFGDEAKQVVLHLLFVHTWFGDSYGSINGVFWSLGVEVEFYLVFPLLCTLVLRNAWIGFGAILAIGLGTRAWLFVHDQSDLVHGISQLPAVIDEFGAGMLTAYLFRCIAVRAPRLAAARTPWTIVALGGFVAVAQLMQSLFASRAQDNWYENWDVFNRTSFEGALVAIALGSLFAHRLWQMVLGNPLLRFLSLISYNLYLWHGALIHALIAYRIPPYAGDLPRNDPAWIVPYDVAASLFSIGVAAVLTYGFERPLLRWRPKRHAASAPVRAAEA